MTAPAGRASSLVVLVGLIAARLSPEHATAPGVDLAFRGLIAFLLGAMLFSFISIDRVTRLLRKAKRRFGLLIELWGVSIVATFLTFADDGLAPLAPIVFWSCLLVFLRKRDAISDILTKAAPQRLGDLAYAIILTHMLLIHPAAGLVADYGAAHAAAIMTFAAPIYIVLLFGLSEIALRVVEIPTRTAMWRWADRAFPPVPRARLRRMGLSVED